MILRNSLKEKHIFRMDLVRSVDRCAAGRYIRRRFEKQDLILWQDGSEFIVFGPNTSKRLVVDIDLS